MFTAIQAVWAWYLTFDPKRTWRERSKFDEKAFHVLLSLPCTMVEWQEGLEQKGLYYEGIIDGTRLDSVLELHRRSTVSTFGTRRSSHRVSATQTDKLTNSENVRDFEQY